MKRFLFLIAALALSSLNAEVLYWMADASEEQVDYIFAHVGVVKDGDMENVICYLDFPEGGQAMMGNEGDYKTGASWADISDYTSNEYGFFVEIMNYGKPYWEPNSGEKWFASGQSAVSSYQDLVSAGHVYVDSLSIPNIQAAWAPTVSAVPEPSGALLFLMGLAVLNLRRRRA